MNLLERLGFVNRDGVVSKDWLKDHHRGEREDFHGVCIAWPINKQADNLAWWNRSRLKVKERA